MSIDLEAIRARLNVAQQENDWESVNSDLVFKDIPALIAEVERQAAEIAAVTAEWDEARYDFAEYVGCGSNDVSPYCKNACTYCVDNHGHCKPHKCRGFAYGPQKGENAEQ